jgi:hypothetical protein
MAIFIANKPCSVISRDKTANLKAKRLSISNPSCENPKKNPRLELLVVLFPLLPLFYIRCDLYASDFV